MIGLRLFLAWVAASFIIVGSWCLAIEVRDWWRRHVG
jgi:hypothetical protein